MNTRRACALVTLLATLTAACSAAVDSNDRRASGGLPLVDDEAADATATTPSPATAASTTTTVDPTTTTTSTTTSTTSSTSSTTTSTTTTVPPLDVYDPACVVQVRFNEGLSEIADRFDDDTVDVQTIVSENDLSGEELEIDQLLDVCVDNGVNDIDGSTRTRNEVLARREVMAQQVKLNELFDGYGIRELTVDGISGPVTRQRLCAFRLGNGLPVTLTDMEAGSEEEQVLMEAEKLKIPFTTAMLSDRWVLIDRTCQIMFVGVGTEGLQFVFPTATGDAEHRTRLQNRSSVFKYNPASDNGGWHDSLTYPAAEDNPLNGNMYKPLYFDNGLAIHGANNVPRSPASKGCARLRVEHQNMLIDWLGLGGQSEVTYRESQIDLTVNVQGWFEY